MKINAELLREFEKGLDPHNLGNSPIKAHLIGFGEISAIFQLDQIPGCVFKRMPLFENHNQALLYENNYHEYCRLLNEAGIELPEHETFVIKKSDDLYILYIAQEQFESADFCHKLIHTEDRDTLDTMLSKLAGHISAVWEFNKLSKPAIELALDGQLSNWVWKRNGADSVLIYIDTSTPLFRKNSKETMDPDLILKSAPAFLRVIIKKFFLDGVMNRYYRKREVYIDMVANLYKEQKPGLIGPFLDLINRLNSKSDPITEKEISGYYRNDKFIWWLFLSARRIDRWVTTKVKRNTYEFMLPEKIRR